MSSGDFSFEKSEFRRLVSKAARIVFFTGAGISTESGISDYRSQGGVWQRYRPVTIQEFIADESSRREFWRRKKEFYAQLEKARPNAAHLAIADLEKSGRIRGIITQNIDGLHQAAGSSQVLEIHGTNLEIICLGCGQISGYEAAYSRLKNSEEILLCETCGGLLKTNTVSFGQELNADILQRSFALARNCDLMIVVGSTLAVEPAASIPRRAKEYGAELIIINREATPLYTMADLNVGAQAGVFFEAVLRED